MSTPPKAPFNLQVAVGSSFGVHYFETPCLLSNLINQNAAPLT